MTTHHTDDTHVTGHGRTRMIWGLSLLSLMLSLFIAQIWKGAEDASLDFRMRRRHELNHILGMSGSGVSQEITLLGIDQKTQARIGKFGTWFSREPYLYQLAYFTKYLHPTVLAYDIIFHSSDGEVQRQLQSATSDRDSLVGMADAIRASADDMSGVIPIKTLGELSRFAGEQGDLYLAHHMAALSESADIKAVLGASFRGGLGEADPATVEPWSTQDVYGDDAGGDEAQGTAIPYLEDIAIPPADIHFPSESAKNDYLLARNAILPAPELRDYARLGFLDVPRDEDSMARRVPMVLGFTYSNAVKRTTGQGFVPSFSLLSCLLHLGCELPIKPGLVDVRFGDQITIKTPTRGTLRIPIDGNGALRVNYLGDLDDFDSVSYFGVVYPAMAMDEEAQTHVADGLRQWIDKRLVMIGVTITGEDVGATPLVGNTPLVYVHMMAASNILSQRFLIFPSIGWLVLLYGIMVLVLMKISRAGAASLGVWTILLLGFYLVLSLVLLQFYDIVLPVIGPGLYMLTCTFSVLSYRFLTEERARKRVRLMFSTMVSGRVLTFLETNPESFSLKGKNTEATVFFSDVEGFTRISEKLDPERVTGLINRYLTPITDSILKHDGFVDKYVGDGVMAVWGAPFPDPLHAEKACRSALEQQKLIRAMNDALEKDFGVRLRVRMGINSGTVTAGNMGSERKFQYTVMGDVVNLASRLEPVNKDFKTTVLISESTQVAVDGKMVTRLLGRLKVVGKQEAVRIYELIGPVGEVPDTELTRIETFEKAWLLFSKKEWDASATCLEGLLKDAPDPAADWLLKQIQYWKQTTPPPGWAGEYTRATKD